MERLSTNMCSFEQLFHRKKSLSAPGIKLLETKLMKVLNVLKPLIIIITLEKL